ncbi:hypothetical protein PVAND_006080 [Polypedilum vanderplanki]|uniref:Uncharacterized protein n=1 Tax=Polypedilum vanderplanki TaxID=319348 RepID=A0A9J6C2H0_POLVA|nr:hypothetical protein PVAND_006080 [Polypedilum vanderplanki]
MFDINKLNSEEYHASAYQKPQPYKFKLFLLIIRIVGVMIVDSFQVLFKWILNVGSKPENIKNQLALVTGGGNGLGRAICFRLAKEQCDLAIADIDYNSALKTANEIMSKHKVTCRAYQCDISKIEEIEKLKNDIESEMREIDILVNNAGLLYVCNFFTSNVNDIKKVVDVNLTAHIVITRMFLNGMIERKRGKILTICSIGSYITVPALNVYCATKFGINGFMQGLADELSVKNCEDFIHLTTVHPDIINTRKEAMDLIDQMNHLVPKLIPERVANEAIDGMLRRKEQIYVSNILWLLFAVGFISKQTKKFLLTKIYDFNSLYEKSK